MQLLKGMRNRELAKSARMFGYDTTFIVQSATREEAYLMGNPQVEHSDAFMVARGQRRLPNNGLQRKRRYDAKEHSTIQFKKQIVNDNRFHGQGRRSRCSRCYRLFHRFGSCPATDRNCIACGERGHFAAACRKKSANNIQAQQDQSSRWTGNSEDKKVNDENLEQNL
ncbi:uncharacterized protein LOC131434150 [Malaya genurostris]|uniref:uncharacterized protein LOC131434150 n=1 Tax=Malaya genurostris TaxID=325434 RepID=UPI0026F3F429|nr:uncharacterized protein LOC131434150 [Malaya genurostris]